MAQAAQIKGQQLLYDGISYEYIPFERLIPPVPPENIENQEYAADIARSLMTTGWAGRPLLGMDTSEDYWDEGDSTDEIRLYTGSHRFAALQALADRGRWPVNLPPNMVPVHVMRLADMDRRTWKTWVHVGSFAELKRIAQKPQSPEAARKLIGAERNPHGIQRLEMEKRTNPISLDPRWWLRHGTVMKPAPPQKIKTESESHVYKSASKQRGKEETGSRIYRGYQVLWDSEGYRIPALDSESVFEDFSQVKRFIDDEQKYRRNPRSAFHQAYRSAKASPQIRRRLQEAMGPVVMRDLETIYKQHLTRARMLRRVKSELRKGKSA